MTRHHLLLATIATAALTAGFALASGSLLPESAPERVPSTPLVMANTQPTEDDQRSAKVEADLTRRLDTLTLKDTPLESALKQWRDKANVPMSIHWPAVESVGITHQNKVTADLQGISFGKALRTILSEVDKDLIFEVDEGTLIVSTRADLSQSIYRTTRTYDISFVDPSGRSESGYELMEAIKIQVAPDSWRDAGGYLGNMRILGHTLWVTQNSANHRQVRQLLDQMRLRMERSTRSYDIRDLLPLTKDAFVPPPFVPAKPAAVFALPDATDTPTTAPTTAPATAPAATQPIAPPPPTPARILMDLLQNHITPNLWRDKANGPYAMSYLDGKLYITTTADTHKQIEDFLKLLRAKP